MINIIRVNKYGPKRCKSTKTRDSVRYNKVSLGLVSESSLRLLALAISSIRASEESSMFSSFSISNGEIAWRILNRGFGPNVDLPVRTIEIVFLATPRCSASSASVLTPKRSLARTSSTASGDASLLLDGQPEAAFLASLWLESRIAEDKLSGVILSSHCRVLRKAILSRTFKRCTIPSLALPCRTWWIVTAEILRNEATWESVSNPNPSLMASNRTASDCDCFPMLKMISALKAAGCQENSTPEFVYRDRVNVCDPTKLA